jgi:hypothetical protein
MSFPISISPRDFPLQARKLFFQQQKQKEKFREGNASSDIKRCKPIFPTLVRNTVAGCGKWTLLSHSENSVEFANLRPRLGIHSAPETVLISTRLDLYLRRGLMRWLFLHLNDFSLLVFYGYKTEHTFW